MGTIIRYHLEETGWDSMDWINLDRNGDNNKIPLGRNRMGQHGLD
jgi:hypothetical protein